MKMKKKKFMTVFCGLVLSMGMMLSFTGCGSEDSGTVSGNSQNGESTPEPTKLLSNSMKRYSTVEEYADAMKESMNAAFDSSDMEGMSMEVYGEGNTLVYCYRYDEAIEVTDAVIDYFESNTSTFQTQSANVVKSIKTVVDAEDISVEFRYENPDGSLVYSCVITGDEVVSTPGSAAGSSASDNQNGKQYASVQAYLDAQQDEIDAAVKQTEGSGMTMEIKAEGEDTLLYRYIYDEAIEVTDAITSYFESSMETNKATFDAVLDEMAELIDVDPKVKLSYENPDGSIIYTYTFTK